MAFWTLYKREIVSYFQSAVAYVVLFGSALVQGAMFTIILSLIVESNYKEQSILQIFFTWILFWVLILVQVPLITMRTFSEEFKLGTIEMLLTAPVREWDVVLAKFFGALSFFLILWLPVVLDLTALQLFSTPPPPIYWSQIGLTALTLVLVGGFWVSLGVFTSVLTKNQIIAAVLSFAFVFAAFGLSTLRYFRHTDANLLNWISYVSTPEHLENAVKGIFDTRPIVFYVSVTFFMLMLTKSILEARRLKG
ncbi:MAG: ABC transporter permease [Methylacidiphilales bacterium]|nr:ABC transporter permease [Candidatus Methylacidiphilales bacterium]